MKMSKWLILPVTLLVIIVGIYCFQVVRFQTRFFPKTTVNGQPVGNLTEKEATELLTKHLNGTPLVIFDEDNKWQKIERSDLDLTYDLQPIIKKKIKAQNPWMWFLSYVHIEEKITIPAKSWNKDQLNETLDQLTKSLNDFNKERKPTSDATIELKDQQFQIIPEVIGNSIDVNKLIKEAEQAIISGQKELQLNDFIKQPAVTSKDKNLNEKFDKIQKIATIQASYVLNGKEVTIPKETIASWITFNEKEIGLNREKVVAYVRELGEKHNTATNSSSFKSTKRGQVDVPAGTFGWTIQTEDEASALIELILKGENFAKRVPVFQGSGTPANELIGSTYIEIDLQNQHMWFYKDGELKFDTAIISGRPDMATPVGVNYVWNKERNAILVGEDYKTPVSYWMPIDWTGVGIHDSPWQPEGSYGGDSHLTIGSHGCINTPPALMSKLFNMVEVGTPAIVF